MDNCYRNITSIQYDHRNLAHLIVTGDGLHRYLYNSEGLRTGKLYKPHSSGFWTVNTRYVRGAFGELLAQYAVSGQNHTLQYHTINTPTGEPLGRLDADTETRYYYLKDHLGSVRVTINDVGDIVGYDDYFPFGMQMSGRSNNAGNTDDDMKFTGHFLESEGGLGIYHAGARLYDPEVPRFYGVDALRSAMPGWNPYHYTFNNPVRYVDPDGNRPCCPPNQSLYYSLKQGGADGFNRQTQINQMTGEGTITGISMALAPAATSVALGFEIFQGGDNYGGSSAQAATASTAMNAFGGKGRLADAGIAAGSELIGGLMSRTISGEEVFDSGAMASDLIFGGGTQLISPEINSLIEGFVGTSISNEGLRRGAISILNEFADTSVNESARSVTRMISNPRETPDFKTQRELAPADNTRVHRKLNN